MEVGIGHHGEPGIAVLPTAKAADMAALMVERIVADLPFQDGDEVVALVSGLGATPLMELYLLYGHVDALLKARGITARRRLVGNYFPSLEMMGASLPLMRLAAALERWLAAPAGPGQRVIRSGIPDGRDAGPRSAACVGGLGL